MVSSRLENRDISIQRPYRCAPNRQTVSTTMVLTAEQIAQWRTSGSVVVDGLLSEDVLKDVLKVADRVYSVDKDKIADFGATNGDMVFPSLDSQNAALNMIPLDQNLILAAAELLGEPAVNMRVVQSEMWSKVGIEAPTTGPTVSPELATTTYDNSLNRDQRIHIDGFNHYLTFPSAWSRPEAVAAIVYYDDEEECGGSTAFVPRIGSVEECTDECYHPQSAEDVHPYLLNPGGRGDLPWINDRTKAESWLARHKPDVARFREKLYAREEYVKYKKGSILFYRLDVWHRGTPVNVGKVRRTHNLLYKKTGCDWINPWNSGSARCMYTTRQTVERLIATGTQEQRAGKWYLIFLPSFL